MEYRECRREERRRCYEEQRKEAQKAQEKTQRGCVLPTARSSAWAYIHWEDLRNMNACVPPPEILIELVWMQPKYQDPQKLSRRFKCAAEVGNHRFIVLPLLALLSKLM